MKLPCFFDCWKHHPLLTSWWFLRISRCPSSRSHRTSPLEALQLLFFLRLLGTGSVPHIGLMQKRASTFEPSMWHENAGNSLPTLPLVSFRQVETISKKNCHSGTHIPARVTYVQLKPFLKRTWRVNNPILLTAIKSWQNQPKHLWHKSYML